MMKQTNGTRKHKLDKAQNFLSSLPLSKNDIGHASSPRKTPVYPQKQIQAPNTRATFYAVRSIPYALSSIIPIQLGVPTPEEEKISMFSLRGTSSRQGSLKRTTSFQQHLQPTGAFLSKSEFGDAITKGELRRGTYDPTFFEEITIKNSAKKTVYGLNGMLGSVISYTKPDDLVKEMNRVFKQMALRSDIELSVDPSLTLTQIRNIKRKMTTVGIDIDMEKLTLASALIYFEKLCLKGVVGKENRRLYGAACLFLAAKVHEIKGFEFKVLANSIYELLDIDFKDILESEFTIFSELEFELYLPISELEYHMSKLIDLIE